VANWGDSKPSRPPARSSVPLTGQSH
jgi:hypothetical protein